MRAAISMIGILLSPHAMAQDIAPAGNAVADRASENLEATSEGERQVYLASAFVRFAPQTALDMVLQIPGFVISEPSEDRGLGEATQNVLINGQRISGKSNDAETVLGRTAAAAVLRIEIADGASMNIPGLTGQVVNIVTSSSGIKGNFSWNPQWRKRIEAFWFNGDVNLSIPVGKGEFNFGLSTPESFRGGGWGPELVTNADGELLYRRERFNQFSGDNPKITGSFSRVSTAGSKFNLNAEAALFLITRRQESDRFTAGAPGPTNRPDITELATGREDEYNYEISSDYSFALAGGQLKLVGYRRFEHSPNQSQFERDFAGASPSEGSQFNRTTDEAETIFRSEFGWKSGASDWSISAEAANNLLDSSSELFVLNNGRFVAEPLDDPNIRVTEKRGQVIASFGHPLISTGPAGASTGLHFQAQIGGEYSVLEQSGARGLTRKFIRPKGQVSLAWTASRALDISAKLQRRVGQLNFFDFLTSVDLQDENNNAGNPNLVPPQSWLGELELNRKLGNAGSVKVKLQYEATTDVVDQIPIATGGEAPGNLADRANRWSGETNVTLLLDRFGWKGAKLDLTGFVQKGRLNDPLTGVRRRFGAERRWTWKLDFRHDIQSSNWAYGFGAEDESDAEFLRLDFSEREFHTRPQTSIFLENKNIRGLKLRGTLINLIGRKEKYREVFFARDRLDGEITEIRDGTSAFGIIGRLSISGTF